MEDSQENEVSANGRHQRKSRLNAHLKKSRNDDDDYAMQMSQDDDMDGLVEEDEASEFEGEGAALGGKHQKAKRAARKPKT